MQISAYRLGYYYNHDVKRERKLLLNKRELRKLEKATKETGYTIVPTKLFTNEKGLAKLEIALARGKKAYDKRETLKEKEDRPKYSKSPPAPTPLPSISFVTTTSSGLKFILETSI